MANGINSFGVRTNVSLNPAVVSLDSTTRRRRIGGFLK